MKKRLFLLAAALYLSVGFLMAIPAHPKPIAVTQPDGTMVTLRLCGDEYLHYTTTDDGYTVIKDNRGFYVYAQLVNGQLETTTQEAHNADKRSAAEQVFLSGVAKHLKPEINSSVAQVMRKTMAHERKVLAARRAGEYDYNNFRGLLILVEFNDKSFSRTDYGEIMENMVNQENYNGYSKTDGSWEPFYGSVRDYFYDSSNGKFSPNFDIVGPVTVNYSQYDPNGTDNAGKILFDAINMVDPEVDFSQYDGDGDGVVDLVFFVVAGNGANYSGNDSRLFWPHRSVIYNPYTYNYVIKDGVYLYDYASSVELQGFTSYPPSVKLDGIGTICHEFSHVLGLPDFYDTDYALNGTSIDPGSWSVMSGGSYLNDSKNPVSYSLYEKYAVGFIGDEDVHEITETGSYSLENIATSNSGYRINTPQEGEYFLLENRQRTGWDSYLPGHGMLVFRVDETNWNVWNRNEVNAYASHNYYELVRAGGADNDNAACDPFPGRNRVTVLDNVSTPANLLTWAGLPSPFGLDNIKEQNGIITFDVLDVNKLVELNIDDTISVPQGVVVPVNFEAVPMYAPYELTWTSGDTDVATVDENGFVTGISAGSTVIKAVDVSGIADSCQVTVFEAAVANNIAEFKTLEVDKESVLHLQDAQVLYVSNIGGTDNVYVRDATGSIVFCNIGFEMKQNELFNGILYAKRSVDGKMPLVLAIGGLTNDKDLVRAEGEEAQPRMVKLSELTDDDMADLVTLQEVRVLTVKEGKTSYAMAKDGESSVFIYNLFKIKDLSMPKNYETKLFNITGIYGSRNFEVSGTAYDDIYPLKKMEVVGDAPVSGVAGIETNPTDILVLYGIDGREIKTADKPGIYLMKRGEKVVKVVKR